MILNDTCQLMSRAATGVDGYGNDVITTTATTPLPCAFVAGAESETTEGSDQTVSNAEAYVNLPPGVTVSPQDQLQYHGVLYEVQALPEQWTSPFTGVQSPTLIKLRSVEGVSGKVAK